MPANPATAKKPTTEHTRTMSRSRPRSTSSSSGKHHVSSREQVSVRQARGEQGSSGKGSGEQAYHEQALDEQALQELAGGQHEGVYGQAFLQQELHDHALHQQTRHNLSTGEIFTVETITGGNTTWGQVRHEDERVSSYESQMANDGVADYAGGSSSSILDDAASHEGEDIRALIRRSVGPEAALADEEALYDTEGNSPSDGDELGEEDDLLSDRDQWNEEEGNNDLGLYEDEDEHQADEDAMGHEHGDQEDYDEDDAVMRDALDDYDQNDNADDDVLGQDDYEDDDNEGALVTVNTPSDVLEDEFSEHMASQQGIDIDGNDSDSNNDRNSASASDSEYDSDNITVRHPGRFTMLSDFHASGHLPPYSETHKRFKHHHTVSEPDEEGSFHSDSSLSELGSTPPPPNPELLAIERAKALAKWPLCKCAGWCSCERYVIFVGDGEEALKCDDPTERDDLCFPSQTHLPEHVLAAEQHPLSAMRTTTNPVDLGGSVQAFSWDSLPKPRRAPLSWIGGEWKTGYQVPAVEDASESE